MIKSQNPETNSTANQWWFRGFAGVLLAGACAAAFWYGSENNKLSNLDLTVDDRCLSFGNVWEDSNGGWDGQQKIQDTSGNWFTVSTGDTGQPAVNWGVGDPNLPPRLQTGSWAFAILPYIEHKGIFQHRTWTYGVELYLCPSRRSAEPTTAPASDQYGYYQTGGWAWGHIDYNGNTLIFPDRPNITTLAQILGGTSTTILVGEKAMDVSLYQTGTWFWDEPSFTGGSGGTARFGSELMRDAVDIALKSRGQWGAAHGAGVQFAFADGSTRLIRYGISKQVMAALITPQGGEAVPADF